MESYTEPQSQPEKRIPLPELDPIDLPPPDPREIARSGLVSDVLDQVWLVVQVWLVMALYTITILAVLTLYVMSALGLF